MRIEELRNPLLEELESLHDIAKSICDSISATGWEMRDQLAQGQVLYFPSARKRGTSLEVAWYRMGREKKHVHVARGRSLIYSKTKFGKAPGWLLDVIMEAEIKSFGPIRERARLIVKLLSDLDRLESLQREDLVREL